MQITEQRFFQILWLSLAVKLLFAWWIPITGDEAYFIVWGNNLDYGYYDHTPMVGWWLAALLQVSDSMLWLRLPSVLITTFIGYAIYRITRSNSVVAATFAGSLFLIAPLNLVGVLITTDTPLILFSFISAWCFYKAQQRDQFAWYLASGILLGLAFFSKFFAGLLGVAYFLYLVLFVRRGWRPYLGLLLVIAGTLPFITLNLLWNYNHCWDNYLFNLVNRTSGSEFSLITVAKYLLVLLYLFTPPVIYYLLRDYRNVLTILKDADKRIYASLLLIPLVLFFLLSFWKVIGLHWLLSFYPFLFIVMAYTFTQQQWLRTHYFMWGFSAIHVIGFAALLLLSPGLLKFNQDAMQSYIYSSHSKQIVEKLNELAPQDTWAANSYTNAAVLSYTSGKHVIQFGEGSYHARQDDMLTDYRALDGKNILILKDSDKLQQFAPYFNDMETGSFKIAGATYYYAIGKGFRYPAYREHILQEVMQFYYRIPAYLPVGSCYMFDKYGKPK